MAEKPNSKAQDERRGKLRIGEVKTRIELIGRDREWTKTIIHGCIYRESPFGGGMYLT